MSNDVWVHQFEIGKLTIDSSKLSNEDKIRLARLENLTKSLIIYYKRSRQLISEFNEGHSTETATNK